MLGSTNHFGQSASSPFGSQSVSGQTNSSNPFAPKPFGSTNPLVSQTEGSIFGGTSTGVFGATQSSSPLASTPTFGAASTTPAFRSPVPVFCSTPNSFGAIGSTTTSAFGSTDSAFGVSSEPAFRSGGAFGASSNPGFGASSTPAFGASNTTAFGSSSTTPSFSFRLTTPAFGQSASSFVRSAFGSTPSPFGPQSSPFGAQATTPAFGSTGFGQSTFGGQRGGSRAEAYSPTAVVDGGWGTQSGLKLESILAMPIYEDKNHEELRWEDYQLGDKGGPNPAQCATAASFGAPAGAAQSNPFGTTATFGQSSTNPISFNTASNPFFQNWQPLGHQPLLVLASPFGASSTTNPFGANSSPSTSLFGAPSSDSAFWIPLNIWAYGLDSLLLIAFGQTNTSNPFAPKPFGSTIPFGSQAGSSIFAGTSNGVFGATHSSSPLASTPTFGAASTTPAFGSSVPVFGNTPNSFGGSSTFGQKLAFGGFGSTPSQSSPFGSSFHHQQTQPGFGSNLFGSSTPFGATSSPAFGSTSTPAFGATSTPAFGSTTTPAFGSTTTQAFGNTGSAFGVSSAPAFGSGGAFGALRTPGFGASSTPAFGASSTPAFGASKTTAPAFGSSSTTPSFSFRSTTPAFGQSVSSFGSSAFGSTPSPFGPQSSPFGAQATTPAFGSTGFGQSTFGGQRGGSRAEAYSPTAEVDGGWGTQSGLKLESISAMPVYKDKNHEELRWEDYQLGDKGGPNPAQCANAASFGAPAGAAQSNPFGTTATFGQSSTNPFSSNTASNPFFQNRQPLGHQPLLVSASPFGASSTTNPFGANSSPSTSLFGAPLSNSVIWIPLNICAYGLYSLLLISKMIMNS